VVAGEIPREFVSIERRGKDVALAQQTFLVLKMP
jgi:hypothetical protein